MGDAWTGFYQMGSKVMLCLFLWVHDIREQLSEVLGRLATGALTDISTCYRCGEYNGETGARRASIHFVSKCFKVICSNTD